MIYLVEDDDSIRELVIYTLHSTGMDATGFSHPSAFWEAVDQTLPDLIILDIMLPEEDGISILKKLKARPTTKQIPVMMLTAKGSEYDQVLGLDSGADDYVAKPFGMMALLARIKAVLRRTQQTELDAELRIGMLAVRTMGFWDKRFLCAIIQLIPAHERSFGDVIPAAHQADIFCLTVQFDTINLCCDFVGQISLVLFLLLCYDGHGD